MANIWEKMDKFLFGPLNSNWCLWFYVFTIYFFALMLFIILRFLYFIASKKVFPEMIFIYLILFALYFAQYIEKRLLHSMCKNMMR